MTDSLTYSWDRLSPGGGRLKAGEPALCGLDELAAGSSPLEEPALEGAIEAQDGQGIGGLRGFVVEPMAFGAVI